jgi:hypothetical protein
LGAVFICAVIQKRRIEEMLNEKDAAKYLGCSVGLLRKWRLLGEGPAFCKLGRLVRYSEADLTAFVQANRVRRERA